MTDPLPLPWYLFFGVAEPESTIANAVSALGYTKTFYRELVPQPLKRISTASLLSSVPAKARMAVHLCMKRGGGPFCA